MPARLQIIGSGNQYHVSYHVSSWEMTVYRGDGTVYRENGVAILPGLVNIEPGDEVQIKQPDRGIMLITAGIVRSVSCRGDNDTDIETTVEIDTLPVHAPVWTSQMPQPPNFTMCRCEALVSDPVEISVVPVPAGIGGHTAPKQEVKPKLIPKPRPNRAYDLEDL